ncbi:MAG TPA: hypothetical protein DCQ14_05420 [Firmicutes bacterium]|nr:hypothetical protein [Bacillota bacterium]
MPVHNLRALGAISFKIIALVIFSFMLLHGIFVTTVSAHRMVIIKGGEGRLQVLYDGGIPAGRAMVTLYDRQGNVIVAEGPVDPDGFFYFDPTLDVGRATASDGLGHLAHFDFMMEKKQPEIAPETAPGTALAEGEQLQPQAPPVEAEQPQVPLTLRVLLGLLFFGIIGIIFQRRKSKC